MEEKSHLGKSSINLPNASADLLKNNSYILIPHSIPCKTDHNYYLKDV